MSDTTAFRQIPSVDRLLNDPGAASLIDVYGRDALRDALRNALDAARQWIRQGNLPPGVEELLNAADNYLRKAHMPSLRPVINATGIIIHTNLGRAPLCDAAQQAISAIAGAYSTLEYQLEDGKRGKRDSHIEKLICQITGAEAAFVVNNNAAAVLLMLTTLAQGREVIISRGQLVEIGGGFRVPDVMQRSGARLIEVGTTNRTNIDDFAQAITPQTALLMHAHASNFKQIGFTSQPTLSDLATLGHKHNLYAVDDLGSGALLDTAPYGLAHEPTVQESLQAGIDLIAFSGDKLLGGPQAGILVGRTDLITRLKKHPLARAVRIDKLSLAALVATLEHYRLGNAPQYLPVWQMIALPLKAIQERAEALAAQVGSSIGVNVVSAQSAVGGGSLPGETLPTFALALDAQDADAFAAKLRGQPIPVIARIAHGHILLDPRTVLPGQDQEVIRAILAVQKDVTRES